MWYYHNCGCLFSKVETLRAVFGTAVEILLGVPSVLFQCFLSTFLLMHDQPGSKGWFKSLGSSSSFRRPTSNSSLLGLVWASPCWYGHLGINCPLPPFQITSKELNCINSHEVGANKFCVQVSIVVDVRNASAAEHGPGSDHLLNLSPGSMK